MPYTGPHSQQDQTVLSDTLNEWREKTNQHADILNAVKMYDVVHGDGITYSRTGGSVTLEVAPNITKGLTIGGDLVVAGNITFTGTAASFDMTTVTIDDHQIELGASGANNIAGADDAGVDDGGIVVLSLSDTNKKWTWRNSFNGHQAWVSNQHIGISAGKAFVGEDDVIRLENTELNGIHVEFKTDSTADVSPIADISYATGATAGIFGVPNSMAGSTAYHAAGGGTGGIRIRQDGTVEILSGVNRKIIDKTGHGFVHGEVVRWDGADWVKAQANSESGAEIFGVVDRYSHNNSNQFVVVTHGEIQGFSGGGGGGENEGVQLTSGEIHFLDPDVAGAMTIQRTYAKGSIVKPVVFGLSETTGYVLNYIGGVVPDQDIVANSIPQTWRIIADGTNYTYGLSGSASTISGSHIVSVNGVMQIPENDGGTLGSGTGITFGITGGTGPASFRIVEGPGPFGFGWGNRIEFAEPPMSGAEVLVMNHALTTPFESIKETYLKSTGATEARNIRDRLGDYVSVKDYGALGDGVTDDTVAIQTAIDQSVTYADQNKRQIFFPTGTYIVTSPLTLSVDGVHLVGESQALSLISFTGTTGPIIQGPLDYGYVSVPTFSNVNFMMDSLLGASAGVCLDFTNVHHVSLDQCTVNHGMPVGVVEGSVGVKLSGYHTHRIIDCAFVDLHKAIVIDSNNENYNSSTSDYNTTNVLIESCQINGAEGDPDGALPNTFGVSIDGGSTGCHNITVNNNKIWHVDYGISVEGPNDSIYLSQNNFSDSVEVGTGMSTCGITADGNTNNLILMGNTGSLYGNTGAAFADNDKFQNRVEIENGSVKGVNIPKVVALFAGRDTNGEAYLIGGTGPGATGTNYNITKVDRIDEGQYTLTFATDLQTDNYSIQGFAGGTAAFVYGGDLSVINESSCGIKCHHVTYGLCDSPYISVTII